MGSKSKRKSRHMRRKCGSLNSHHAKKENKSIRQQGVLALVNKLLKEI